MGTVTAWGSDAVRHRIERREFGLSRLAAKSMHSRGRARSEPESPIRTCFQRDRDRVIHCKAFRRLKDKTQVFIAPRGDHYVTRLTHTIELSQIARTIARALNLNEDLTEAIALAHDLGHPPFGHAGEEALDGLVEGGFRHNFQSLRVVDVLEGDGVGLNLTWETRESIPTHSKVREGVTAPGWGVAAMLEGQVCKLADAIAYLNHDIGDAVRAGLIGEEDLPSRARDVLGPNHSVRIDTMVRDVVSASWHAAQAEGDSADQDAEAFARVRDLLIASASRGEARITMSSSVREAVDELRDYMFRAVYLNSDARPETGEAQDVIRALFHHFVRHREQLPGEFRNRVGRDPIERVAVDYIAGMTDRFARACYERVMTARPVGL